MRARTQHDLSLRRFASLALMPAAAFAVHQLRYWLAFGAHAGAQLQAQGHSYLHSVVPWIVLLIAISAGLFLRILGRALGGHGSLPRYTLSFAVLWVLCALCLIALYATQELLEGLFVTGHPGGWVGIFGYGGWWSIPAAAAVGLVLAAVFHGARRVLEELAERRPRPLVARSEIALPRAPQIVPVPRLAPLVGGWSDRGPPR